MVTFISSSAGRNMEKKKIKVKSSPALILVLLYYFLIPVLGQLDPRDQNAVANSFYLTSRSDCDENLKNIYNYEAIILGYDQSNVGTGPKTCTIRITSQQALYQSVQLQIKIMSADIKDCGTQLSIYDGQGTQTLASFDCHSPHNINRMSPVTSGDTVSFVLHRQNPDKYNFDIEIRVKPIRGGWDPDDKKYNFFNFQKFDQKAIVGMIGGFYALIIIICVSIVLYCNIRYRGLDKKWETHQLATMKTDASFVDSRSQVSQPPWSVGGPSQRGPTSQYSRSIVESYARKGPASKSEDGSSVYDHEERFQQRNLVNEERNRNRGRSRMASQNTTYSDEVDEDPDNFKEKVITSRVKSTGRWKPKDRRPPSFEEATRGSSSEERSSEEDYTEESSDDDDDSTRKRLTTSSEEEDSETETETESEYSGGSSRRGARGGRRTKDSRQNKGKRKPKRKKDQSFSDDASSHRTEPRGNQPRPQPPLQPMHGAMPYGAYPQPGGQFIPVMAGPPPQFQPVQMLPPNYPPPQYPTETSTDGHVKPTDPPVYSYLVRRGYTPLDSQHTQNRHNSPAGSAISSQRNREEPETPLQSGVEYMRR